MPAANRIPRPIDPVTELDELGADGQATEKTISFSDGYVECRVEEMKGSSRLAGGWISEHNEAVAELDNSHGNSTEQTASFPKGYVESRAEVIRQQYQEGQETLPICELETKQLGCRLLIQPRDLDTFKGPLGEWICLRQRSDLQASHTASVRCLAVTQSHEDISCKITSPIACELYYDSKRDSIEVWNTSSTPFRLSDIFESGTTADRLPGDEVIVPYDHQIVLPGAWKLSSLDGHCAFQVLVFPRSHSFALAHPDLIPETAGSKRTRSSLEALSTASILRQSAVIKRLDTLAEMSDGDMVHVATASMQEDYTLFRMRKVGDTRAARVFQARHSDYPNQIVIVKAFKLDPRHSARSRGESWKREYGIHRRLLSEVIVELFGGDARLEALILQRIDARDLAHNDWCNQQGDKRFRGEHGDAMRVLVDMTRALQHLREKKVLHNDIKPSNILYGEETGAVLIDFGLGTLEGSLPSSGGTPWYVAPEYLNETRREAAAEVWALGIVMIYLLKLVPIPDSGRQVKSWLIRDVDAARHALVSPAVSSMQEWLEVVNRIVEKLAKGGDYLSGIVLRMLAPEPEQRITASELVNAVDETLVS